MQHKAMLWKELSAKEVRCDLCAHHCVISDGNFGACGMRQNIGGELYTFAYGEVIASHIDPVEKKPLYHFLPGTYTYSIATIGCNFRCGFCQNWTISQLSRRNGDTDGQELEPARVVSEARRNKCDSISYTYTEPTVFFEYALDTAKLAKNNGLRNIFVTNGYMSDPAVDAMTGLIDAANIDLKSFSEKTYRSCGGSLLPVLNSIEKMRRKNIWTEITTLVVPGMNDDDAELREIAAFISSVSPAIPWHVSRFHPDFKMTGKISTPFETLMMAKQIGEEEGLKYVYLGNVGPAGTETFCPGCNGSFISRAGFSSIRSQNFSKNGRCLKCGTHIEGVWE